MEYMKQIKINEITKELLKNCRAEMTEQPTIIINKIIKHNKLLQESKFTHPLIQMGR